jgi:peptide/nickel transport system permease protein
LADRSSGGVAGIKRRSRLVVFFIRLVKEKPLGTVGGVITLLLLFVGIFADLIAPYGMNESWVAEYLTPPSSLVWMGTDNLGRDVLSRVVFGARISMIVGLGAAGLATLISLIIGIVSGYLGGIFDLILQRFVDAEMCVPRLVLMMVLITIIGAGLWQVIVVLGVAWGIAGSRLIRSAVIGIRENMYVEAARTIGCSTPRMFLRHIFPNIMAVTIIQFSMRVPNAILVEASLSFLGFGVPPPQPSWGGMLSGVGRANMISAPWLVVWPGLALAVAVFGVNIFGDALRDLLDPRLVGGVGRYGVGKKKKETTGV